MDLEKLTKVERRAASPSVGEPAPALKRSSHTLYALHGGSALGQPLEFSSPSFKSGLRNGHSNNCYLLHFIARLTLQIPFRGLIGGQRRMANIVSVASR